MKALTLHQPWASLVALGVKTIETRSWATKYRGPLAIHAGAKRPRRIWSQHERPDLYDDYRIDRYLDIQEDGNIPGQFAYDWAGPLGAVVATCELVDVVSTDEAKFVNDGALVGAPNWSLVDHSWRNAGGDFLVRERERPYGDFSPGRFAWVLDKIEPLREPVPAKGHQGVWEWTP